MVYIGGGDTEGMVASWRRNGWDRVLCDASKSGLTLAGVSAGAVCWFDRFLFNSGNGPLRPLRGLGLIAAGACPHYSTELERRAALHASVANGAMPTSFAIDDGVAVAFNGSSPVSICVAEQGADAYQVSCDEQGIVTEVALDI
jgi:dipeptidase E